MGTVCSAVRNTHQVIVPESTQKTLAGTKEEKRVSTQKTNKKINKQLKLDAENATRVHRVVFLGAGECGKTTLLQHMSILHGKQPTPEEKNIMAGLIQATVVEYMCTLLTNAHSNTDSDTDAQEMSDEEFQKYEKIVQGGSQPFTMAQLKEKSDIFLKLWKLERVQKAFQRSDEFHLPDHAEYFFEKLDDVMQPDYIPSVDDILRIRVQSTGITEVNLDIDNQTFTLVDVGGQRSERKKWLHCFTDVSAVVFVSSLAEFDQKCFEDSNTPRWKESLKVWKSVCSSQHLSTIPFILFLNKHDLFLEKIQRRYLGDFISDYKGDGSPSNCIEFFINLYSDVHRQACEESRSRHDLYIHLTTAIDPENVKKMFNDVRHTVLVNSLDGGGLLPR